MEGSNVSSLASASKALVCIEPTDPDNFALLIGVIGVFGIENVAVILTGRCAIDPEVVKQRVERALEAGLPRTSAIPMEEWDREFSTLLHKVSALRVEKLLETLSGASCPIFDGGFSKQPRVPHALHIDDLYGFGDIEEAEVERVKLGEVCIMQTLDEILDFLGDDTFVAFLGGPATGLKLLFEAHPELIHRLTGVFAQYGSLGQVKGMEIKGRSERAQFNVLLDADAGKLLVERCEEHNVPFYFLTSDVTRRAEIGFGTYEHLSALLRPRSSAVVKLCVQWKIWYEEVVKPRSGELLLTHDMSCLLAYLQLMDACSAIYEFKAARILRFETAGDREGEIEFDLSESNGPLYTAVKLVDRGVYSRELRRSLGASEPPKQIAFSASLQHDSDEVYKYNDAILKALLPLLEDGGIVHWGSHPSTFEVMRDLAMLYPGQFVQHLLRRFAGSRLSVIPEEHVRYHDDLVDLRVAMLSGKDIGVFVAGRTDLENSIEGRSGVLVEYVFFVAVNPEGEVREYPLNRSDISSFIALNHSIRILGGALQGEGLKMVGSLLESSSNLS